MTTKQIEHSMQPRIVRDAFGYPRLAQPNEPTRKQSAVFSLIAFALAVAVAGAALGWLS